MNLARAFQLKTLAPFIVVCSAIGLISCGGSGSGGSATNTTGTTGTKTTGTTATNTTGTSATTTGSLGVCGTTGSGGYTFNSGPQRTDVGLLSYAPNGQLVGFKANGASSNAVYAANPTAATVNLPVPAGQTEIIGRAVNNNGNIVGYSNGQNHYAFKPYFWSSPTATPVAMALPSTAIAAGPIAISNTQVIVGIVSFDQTVADDKLYVWPTPTSQPVLLSNQTAFYGISSSGAILVLNSPNYQVFATYKSAPITLLEPGGKAPISAFMGPDGTIVGTGQGQNGLYWLPTNYSTGNILPQPSGSSMYSANGVNSSHVICGYYMDSSGVPHACYWPTVSSTAVDLLNAAGTCKVTLDTTRQVLDDGIIVALYDTAEAFTPYLVEPTAKPAIRR